MQFPSLRSVLALSLMAPSLALVGCDPAPTVDAGADAPLGDAPMGTDTPMPRDTPTAPGVCASARAVTLTLGENSITGNTMGRGMDLALTCGSMGETAAPQEALTLTVPGDAATTYALTLTTAAPGTAVSYDTQLEIRPNCASETNAVCNDDINYPDEPRSSITVPVPGGTVLTAIVSGYQAMFSGPWELTATVAEVNPPTLTGIDVTIIDDTDLRASIMGGDVDGNATGILLELLGADGMPIAVDTDMDIATPPVSEFPFDFVDSVAGMTTFTGTVRVGGLNDFPAFAAAVEARVRVVDDTGEESTPLTEAIIEGTYAARGGACDEMLTFCPGGLTCEAMVCAIPAPVVTACGGATGVTLVAPTATALSTTTIDATVAMADGVLTAPCQANTPGAEDLYNLTVPAGNHDLLVTTAGTRTADADTIVYLMTTCGDPLADPDTYCSDDVSDSDLTSSLVVQNLAEGTYTLAVESFGAAKAAVPVGVTVTLRAVLDSGAMCDMAGVNNRCAGAACAAGVCP